MTQPEAIPASPVEALVREHARMVFKVAYSVLHNHADAEDAAQETFLRLLKYAKKLDEVENPRLWLAKMAWRVALDRSKRPSQSEVDIAGVIEQLRSSEPHADDAIEQQQRMALLHRLIASLPPELREVVELSNVEDMTSADVGEMLGIPEGSVRGRLMRAREMMKLKLASVLEGKSRV